MPLKAFTAAKDALTNATLLSHPVLNAPTSLMTDAFDVAVGAVLQRFVEDKWRPIAYFFRKLKSVETRYSTFDRELLGIYLSIRAGTKVQTFVTFKGFPTHSNLCDHTHFIFAHVQ